MYPLRLCPLVILVEINWLITLVTEVPVCKFLRTGPVCLWSLFIPNSVVDDLWFSSITNLLFSSITNLLFYLLLEKFYIPNI